MSHRPQPVPTPELSAIVVCRNDEDHAGHTIGRLAAHLSQLGVRAEILAVDERSSDNTLPLLSLLGRELPSLRVIAGVAPGGGHRRGVEEAGAATVLLLEARCDSPLSAIGFALARLEGGLDAIAVHGRFLLLRRGRVRRLLAALVHHPHRAAPAELHRRLLRRARALGLRVEVVAEPRGESHPLARLRDALLLPIASRAWW